MYAGIIIWPLQGDVGQLKGSISSNIVIPICSAFFTSNQALRSLSDDNALVQPSASQSLQENSLLLLQCYFSLWYVVDVPSFSSFIISHLPAWTFTPRVVRCVQLRCKDQSRSCLWLHWGTGSAGYTHLTLLEFFEVQRKEVINLVWSD